MRFAMNPDIKHHKNWDRYGLRPGGTFDSSPAIYRRVNYKNGPRPGGTFESWPRLVSEEQ
jgi:hypothetical protein